MKFSCPHCGQSIEADEGWVGHSVDCPSCGQSFVVRAPKGTSPLKPVRREVLPGVGVVRGSQPRRPTRPPLRPTTSYVPPKRRKRSSLGKFLLFLLLVAIGGFGYAS